MFPEYEHREQPIYAKLHTYQCNYPARFHKHVEILAVVKTASRLHKSRKSHPCTENK